MYTFILHLYISTYDKMACSYNLSHFNQFSPAPRQANHPMFQELDMKHHWCFEFWPQASSHTTTFPTRWSRFPALEGLSGFWECLLSSWCRFVSKTTCPFKAFGPSILFSSSKYFGSMSPTHFFWKEKHWPLGQTTQAIWKSHHFF